MTSMTKWVCKYCSYSFHEKGRLCCSV